MMIARIEKYDGKFQLKRRAWNAFKRYDKGAYGTALFDGDLLKVPRGITVKIKCDRNGVIYTVDDNDLEWSPQPYCPV